MVSRMQFSVDRLQVSVYPSPEEASAAAAEDAAAHIRTLLPSQRNVSVMFASAPSQELTLVGLLKSTRIDWQRVVAFHMDEYVGLPVGSERSFAQWIRERLALVNIGLLHLIIPDCDAEAAALSYGRLIVSSGIDLTLFGIGSNGHIAFNEPGADFEDSEVVRVVKLSQESRQQQVDEGLFESLSAVPIQALTVTIPVLLSAKRAIGTVLGRHKANAVERTLRGPIGPSCPATSLRRHPNAALYLDASAAEAWLAK